MSPPFYKCNKYNYFVYLRSEAWFPNKERKTAFLFYIVYLIITQLICGFFCFFFIKLSIFKKYFFFHQYSLYFPVCFLFWRKSAKNVRKITWSWVNTNMFCDSHVLHFVLFVVTILSSLDVICNFCWFKFLYFLVLNCLNKIKQVCGSWHVHCCNSLVIKYRWFYFYSYLLISKNFYNFTFDGKMMMMVFDFVVCTNLKKIYLGFKFYFFSMLIFLVLFPDIIIMLSLIYCAVILVRVNSRECQVSYKINFFPQQTHFLWDTIWVIIDKKLNCNSVDFVLCMHCFT